MDREDDFTTFVDRENGEYRAVLILLAIIIGRPAVALEILDALNTAENGKFLNWLDELSKRYEKESLAVEDRPAGNNEAGAANAPSSHEIRLVELRETAREIRRSIDAVQETLEKTSSLAIDDRLPSYTKWACEVGHYLLR